MCICFDKISECDGQRDGFTITVSRSTRIGMMTHDKNATQLDTGNIGIVVRIRRSLSLALDDSRWCDKHRPMRYT